MVRRRVLAPVAVLLCSLAGACGHPESPASSVAFEPARVELHAEPGHPLPLHAMVHLRAARPIVLEVSCTAAWLRAGATRPAAPGDLELTAEVAALPAGTHTAQVIARPDGGDVAILPVTLVLGTGPAPAPTGDAPAAGAGAPAEAPQAAPAPPAAEVPAPAAEPTRPWPPPDAKIERAALDRVLAATVLIESTYRPHGPSPDAFPESERRVAWGSGFVVHPEGLILTNAHVVDPVLASEGEGETPARAAATRRVHVLDHVTVRLRSGSRSTKVYDAQVLCTRPYPLDLALLRIVPDEPLQAVRDLEPAVRAGANFMIAETHRVWAVGFPLGKEMEAELERFHMSRNPNGPDPSVREGVVTALRKDENGVLKAVEHSCNIEPGNSGGPLVNFAGQLVGVNSLGGGRSAFAIPIDRVLDTFFDVLACSGYGNLFEQVPHRTVRVDPQAEADASNPDRLVVTSLLEGLRTAKLGDVIDIADGEYELTESLVIPAGARVHGAGMGRTVIRAVGAAGKGLEGYAVNVGGPRYFELHDLTLVNEGGNGLWLFAQCHEDTFLHDVEIRAKDWALGVGKQGSADVVDCRVHGGVVVFGPPKGAGPRFARTLVSVPADSLFVQAAVGLRDDAVATLEGCRLLSSHHVVTVAKGAHATLRGAELGTSGYGGGAQEAAVSAWGGEADLADCSLWTNGVAGVRLEDGARATVAGCRFTGDWRPAVEVVGEGTRVGVSGSVFDGAGAALFVRQGARAELRVCAILHDDDRDLDAARWRDVPAGLMPAAAAVAAPFYVTPEQRAAMEAAARKQRAERPFGVVVSGSTGTVDVQGNLFRSASGGTAIRLESGASFMDRGGNEVVGASQAVLRTDDTYFYR